jgi:hypothetical protein
MVTGPYPGKDVPLYLVELGRYNLGCSLVHRQNGIAKAKLSGERVRTYTPLTLVQSLVASQRRPTALCRILRYSLVYLP